MAKEAWALSLSRTAQYEKNLTIEISILRINSTHFVKKEG